MGSLNYNFDSPFDLKMTFECGQIFRYEEKNEFSTVFIPLKDRILKINQETESSLVIESNKNSGLKDICDEFLRVNDDYAQILQNISIDPLMKKIVSTCTGLRLLKQDLFECMISFILSQCSNIPRITQNLNSLSKRYGTTQIYENIQFQMFPTMEELKGVNEEDFRDMGFGYRAKYLDRLINQCPKFLRDAGFCVDINREVSEINKDLNSIYGIGQKVADCVHLFAVGDLRLFPVDTWMKKFMMKYYCTEEKISEKKIRLKGQELFGKWAGYAQQFIFHYSRNFETYEQKPKSETAKSYT